jgi:branched-chain amino acid transport system substrate-binding protein
MSTKIRFGRRWMIGLAFASVLAVTGCQRDVGGKKAIRIAAVAPTTGSQAETGQDLINGIKQAVDEKNAAGGVLGRNIELLVFDDSADPKEAVSVAHKIAVDSTIVGVVGHMNSGTAKAASPIYSQAGIPMVMPVPTNPDITKQGFTNLFRVPPTDLDQGTDVARYAIEKLGKKRFAIVHDSTAYGQPLAEVVRQTVKEAGGEVLTFDGINEGDKDFRALLTRIRAAKPDVLFFGGIYNEAGLLAKQAKELGVKATFLAADGSFGQKFIDIAGPEAAEGAVMTFIAPDERTSETMHTFAEKFRTKYGSIKAFAPLGYDAANILLAGIAKAGNTDHASVIAALHSQDFEYSGVTGKSRFEPNGNNMRRTVFFFQVSGGQYQPVAR